MAKVRKAIKKQLGLRYLTHILRKSELILGLCATRKDSAV